MKRRGWIAIALLTAGCSGKRTEVTEVARPEYETTLLGALACHEAIPPKNTRGDGKYWPRRKDGKCYESDKPIGVATTDLASTSTGNDYRYIRRSGGGRLTTQETPQSIPYEDAYYADYDISNDGKHWFHLLGERCFNKCPWVSISTAESKAISTTPLESKGVIVRVDEEKHCCFANCRGQPMSTEGQANPATAPSPKPKS